MVTRVAPRTPKGMRDLLPEVMLRRRYVIDLVQGVFEAYGFEPLQTPALELRETLMGKYGPDAEKLIYQADHPQGREKLALRYDLSVPLSRVVAMHPNLPRPFKRYQIAPVWRAERPQRGRYREFVQCDVDTVGAAAMQADAEMLQIIGEVLTRLGFARFTIRLNNRKILNGIGRFAGVPDDQLPGLYRAIDKLERIGLEGVEEELRRNQVAPEAIRRLISLLGISDGPRETLEALRERLVPYAEANEGIEELVEILRQIEAVGLEMDRIRVECAMVRGLEYYTGPIYETVVTEPRIGSLTGGGRYDRLIGMFTGRDLPATGTTIGIERIIDVMDDLQMFPAEIGRTVAQVLVTVFDQTLGADSARAARTLREHGVRTEVFLDRRPLADQTRYADKKGIPLVVFIGPEEVQRGALTVKHLGTGTSRTVPTPDAAELIRRWLSEAPA